jgi:hypothetical protein
VLRLGAANKGRCRRRDAGLVDTMIAGREALARVPISRERKKRTMVWYAVFSTKAVSISPIDREHTPFIVPIERHVFYFQKNTFQVEKKPA